MINNIPYDKNTHNNPWLINTNKDESIIGPEGVKLTADYIWSKEGVDREDLVRWVFDYYRGKGFIKSELSDEYLKGEFNKLRNKKEELGEFVSNSSSLCNDVYRHFVWEKYYSARGKRDGRSVIDVFNDDTLFLNVLKNRMGYCISKEDGEERPYVFAITDKMILQGIHSTGFGYNVSLFKPMIGKLLYENFARSRVFDYSAGWGARCLAAMSLGLEYYGVDPLTSCEVNKMMKFFNGKGFVLNGCSEDVEIYCHFPKVDCVLSCPPYFDLEIYSDDARQSTNKFREYDKWLGFYWRETVKNCISILEEDGFFVLIIKDMVGKHNLAENMSKICLESGLNFHRELCYKTSTNHLSSKKKTGKVSKNSEKIMIFKKV